MTGLSASVIIITGERMPEKRLSISDALKQAIAESGMALSAIERETGVRRASVMRFLRGETSLRLDIADKLAAFFGIEVVRRRRKGR